MDSVCLEGEEGKGEAELGAGEPGLLTCISIFGCNAVRVGHWWPPTEASPVLYFSSSLSEPWLVLYFMLDPVCAPGVGSVSAHMALSLCFLWATAHQSQISRSFQSCVSQSRHRGY